MQKELKNLRKQIDKIDKKLHKQLLKREKVVTKIGEIKKQRKLPIHNPQREKEVLSKIENKYVKKIFKEIIEISRRVQG